MQPKKSQHQGAEGPQKNAGREGRCTQRRIFFTYFKALPNAMPGPTFAFAGQVQQHKSGSPFFLAARANVINASRTELLQL